MRRVMTDLRGRRVAVNGRCGVISEHRRGKRPVWPADDVLVIRLDNGETIEVGLADVQEVVQCPTCGRDRMDPRVVVWCMHDGRFVYLPGADRTRMAAVPLQSNGA
jgi:hypothetical protein